MPLLAGVLLLFAKSRKPIPHRSSIFTRTGLTWRGSISRWTGL